MGPARKTERRARRWCFVFVCQAGELEIKALLLAASLKQFLRCEYELVAAVPSPAPVWGELDSETIDCLHDLGVRIEPITNPIHPSYPIANKLSCLTVATTADVRVFLDSDILCMKEWEADALPCAAFGAKPADLRTFSATRETWSPLYEALGTTVPDRSLPTTVSNQFGPPYFNSGVVIADRESGLGQAWIECARVLDAPLSSAGQRHWLDQVSLSIAMHKLGHEYFCLDERHNFPAHLKPLASPTPFLCHYHWPRIVRSEPLLCALVQRIARKNSGIRRAMERYDSWASVLDTRLSQRSKLSFLRRDALRPELLVTGIPGSGEDVLAQRLDSLRHCVLVDEPEVIRESLATTERPWQLAAWMRDSRREILDGRSACELRDAEPPPQRLQLAARGANPVDRHFVLVVKNMLPLMCRLSAVRRVAPHVAIAVCVSAPEYAIANWKSSPATMERLLSTMRGCIGLSSSEQAALEAIAGLRDVTERRARWWAWLAEHLLNHADGVHFIRHSDDPNTALPPILKRWRLGQTRSAYAASAPADVSSLDRNDRAAIHAICGQLALELDVPSRVYP